MKQAYRYAIVYFVLFTLLLLAGATVLFSIKIGFSAEAVTQYYAGNADQFIEPKSARTLIEIMWRHLGSMGLLIVVLAHFMLFASKKAKARAGSLIWLLFAAALFNILSPYGIVRGESFFVWLKLAGTAGLMLGFVLLLWLLFVEAWRGIREAKD